MSLTAAIAIGAPLAFASGALLARKAAWRRHVAYDPAIDQRWSFDGTVAEKFDVALDGQGFGWPENAKACDTALLELELRRTPTGHFNDPSIATASSRQYFERGAMGRRYLNLSAHAGSPGRIELRGSGVRWRAQTARLFLFNNSFAGRPRTMVVAPHPDDAEIAAFGLYHRSDALIVTVTAGDRGTFYRERIHRPGAELETTAFLRVWDTITVPTLGGVPPAGALNLGFGDSTLAAMHAAPDQSVSGATSRWRNMNLSPLLPDWIPTWRGLVRDLAHLIATHRPDFIATPHPQLDDHPDHIFTTAAVCEAIASAGVVNGNLLLYTNHAPPTHLHPFGAHDGYVSLPPRFGEPALFRSILSLPLDARTQEMKFLAIAAMHDVRRLPRQGLPSWRQRLRSIAAEVRAGITGIEQEPASYFRRGPRPNELFFVVPVSEAAMLRALVP